MLIHEGGHYLAALRFGHRLRFSFSLGWLGCIIPVPRFIWRMPEMAPWQQAHVALAGFAAEFASVAAAFVAAREVWLWYLGVVAAHFVLYPLYAGEESDWKWV